MLSLFSEKTLTLFDEYLEGNFSDNDTYTCNEDDLKTKFLRIFFNHLLSITVWSKYKNMTTYHIIFLK